MSNKFHSARKISKEKRFHESKAERAGDLREEKRELNLWQTVETVAESGLVRDEAIRLHQLNCVEAQQDWETAVFHVLVPDSSALNEIAEDEEMSRRSAFRQNCALSSQFTSTQTRLNLRHDPSPRTKRPPRMRLYWINRLRNNCASLR